MRMLMTGLAAGLFLALTAGHASANPPTQCGSGCGNECGSSCGGNPLARFAKPSCGNGFKGLGLFSGFCAWVKAPSPTNAPTCRPEGELAFQNHPYIRSPRDYFMHE